MFTRCGGVVHAASSATRCMRIYLNNIYILNFFLFLGYKFNLVVYFPCAQKFFRKKPVKDMLPAQPVESIVIEPWWIAQTGYIVEDDIRVSTN